MHTLIFLLSVDECLDIAKIFREEHLLFVTCIKSNQLIKPRNHVCYIFKQIYILNLHNQNSSILNIKKNSFVSKHLRRWCNKTAACRRLAWALMNWARTSTTVSQTGASQSPMSLRTGSCSWTRRGPVTALLSSRCSWKVGYFVLFVVLPCRIDWYCRTCLEQPGRSGYSKPRMWSGMTDGHSKQRSTKTRFSI